MLGKCHTPLFDKKTIHVMYTKNHDLDKVDELDTNNDSVETLTHVHDFGTKCIIES
jgi:hypothetical protein